MARRPAPHRQSPNRSAVAPHVVTKHEHDHEARDDQEQEEPGDIQGPQPDEPVGRVCRDGQAQLVGDDHGGRDEDGDRRAARQREPEQAQVDEVARVGRIVGTRNGAVVQASERGHPVAGRAAHGGLGSHERLRPAARATPGHQSDLPPGVLEHARRHRRPVTGPTEDGDRVVLGQRGDSGRQVGDEDQLGAGHDAARPLVRLAHVEEHALRIAPGSRAVDIRHRRRPVAGERPARLRPGLDAAIEPARHPLVADAQQLGRRLGEGVRSRRGGRAATGAPNATSQPT